MATSDRSQKLDNNHPVMGIFPLLLKQSEPTFKAITAEVQNTGFLPAAIATVISEQSTPKEDKDKLSIFSSLYNLLGNEGVLAIFKDEKLKDLHAFIDTPQRLVELLAAIRDEAVPRCVVSLWPQVRQQLFERIPTFALAGFLRSGVVAEPDPLKGKISMFLQIASEELHFDISKQTFQGIFRSGQRGMELMYKAEIATDQIDAARSFLLQLQQLQVLVDQPEDIGVLIDAGYISSEAIASDEAQVLGKLTKLGVPSNRAEKILAHALAIDLRRERLWAEALKARGTSGIADMAIAAVQNSPNEGKSPASPTTTSQEINLSTMFSLESMGCVECASTLSPAAYFVYLLEELDKIKCKNEKSLLAKLMSRRADLGKLQLSCANTKIPIPYVDLVNEVLESALARAAQLPDNSYNMGGNDEQDMYLPQPRTTNYAVYEKVIQDMIFPMNVYPYNQAMHSIRAFLAAIGLSRHRLLITLRSLNRIQTYHLGVSDAKAVSDRAITAETLGLQHEDYVAITKEGFYTHLQIQASNANLHVDAYHKQIGLKTRPEYWGYSSDTEMTGPSGLTDIKNQLLPRSGLSFQDLLSLLRTRFIGRRLVILSKERTIKFDGSLADMRLWQIPLKNNDAKNNIVEPSLCDQIQGFLRLRSKIQWSIEDLDALFFTLAGSRTLSIDAQFLDHLAAVKRLATITALKPSELQPMWGEMNSLGETSLYVRLFCRPDAGENNIFLPSEIAKGNEKISNHLGRVLLALQITAPEYESIKSGVPDWLSLASISQLYRISLLCKVLGISPLDYEGLVSLYGYDFDPFKDPVTTLSVVQRFIPNQSPPLRWTFPELLFIIRGIRSALDDSMNTSLQKDIEITTTISSKLASSRTSGNQQMDGNLVSQVTRLCTRLLGAENGQKVVDFLQDPKKAPKPTTGENHFLIEVLKPYLGLEGTQSLLNALSKGATTLASQDPDDKGQVEQVQKAGGVEATEEQAVHRRRLFINTISPIMAKAQNQELILTSLRSLLPNLDPTTMQFALSEVIKQREETPSGSVSITPGMDILLRLGDNPPVQNGYDGYFRPPTTDIYSFTDFAEKGGDSTLRLEATQLDFGMTGSKQPVATSSRLLMGQWYKFHYNGDVTKLKWAAQQAIGVAPASFTQDTLIDERSVSSTGAVVAKLMRLSLVTDRLALQDNEVEFWQNTKQFDFNALALNDISRLEKYQILRDDFVRAFAKRPLIELYKWLFSQHHDQKDLLSKHLASVTTWPEGLCADFLKAKYPNLDESSRREAFKDICTLFEMWEAMRLVRKANLSNMSLESLFTVAEPTIPASVGAVASKDFENAAVLRSAMQSRMSPSSMNAGPTPLSAANDQIRDGQRNALIQCFFSEKYKVHEYVTTPEKLFGYFLCDVEMGPELQTSRIKQAISTVQLFIQRCILGSESLYGTDDTARQQLMTRDLESMLRYSLWAAKRKSFLYPENWLDPTLRDDKTEQFRAVESTILETKLDMDTIATLVKGYTYRVNEVADLQVEAYLWERKDKRTEVKVKEEDISYESVFHIFARSRTSPATFYYRRLQLEGSNVNPIAHWSPWTKMNVDIPVQDLDEVGNKLPKPGSYLIPAVFNGRLLVFLPAIVSRKIETREEKTEEKSSETTGPSDQMVEFLKQTVPQSDHQRQWEIRLGFIEYQNGEWSNKKVSQSAIYVAEEAKKLPSISGFQFQIESRPGVGQDGDILRVRVSRLDKAAMTSLGLFEMRQEQLVLVDEHEYPVSWVKAPPITKSDPAYDIEFSKLISRNGSSWGDRASSGLFSSSNPQPILPVKRKRKSKVMSHSLVLSFDHTNYKAPTGFFLESSDADKVQTFFNFPPDYGDYILTETDPSKKDILEGQRLTPENLSDYINPILLKSMNTGKDLQPLYATLRSFNYASRIPCPGDYSHDIFGRRNSLLPHELSTPFAIYNWELGVHIPSLLMERLMATQQWELALSVARLVFDPTIVGGKVEEAWSFPPFRDDQVRTHKGDAFDREWTKRMTQNEWLESKGNVHAAARGNPAAYMHRIAIKYIEILIAAGDEYFRQDTLESIPLALQRYTEASQVFGPQPATIPRLGKPAVMTYNQIKGRVDSNTNLKVDLGLEFPFYGIPGPNDPKLPQNDRYLGFVRTDYFCVPANPAFVALRNRIDDRLYNIRHGMDINGRKRTLALFEPPIDPGALVGASANRGGASLGGLLDNLDSPMPKYRFEYLIQRAHELVNDLKATGQQLLSIKEKKDAEGLSMLRYKHQRSVLCFTTKIKEHQKKEVQKSREVLEESRRQQEMHLAYFLQLTGETKTIPQRGEEWKDIQLAIEAPTKDDLRMSPYENMEGISSDMASTLNTGAANLEATAADLLTYPTITTSVEPWGVGISTSIGGSTVGQAVQSQASHLRARAQTASDQAARAARKSILSRQLQERLFQANTIGRELMRIDKDMAQLDVRDRTADMEIKAAQHETENMAAEEEWMRRKYTSQQLYTFLDNSISQIFHQTYLLSFEMAKIARRALDFEHSMRFPDSSAVSSQPITNVGGYWEKSIDGLTSGDALLLDLRKMEMMHMENSTHDFEIVKMISLRQLNPLSLIQFQEKGTADFSLDESLFDKDFPGHYCRRISSVALSIPCIVGAYTSFNCTLTLTTHKYRVSQVVKDPNSLYEDEEGKYRTDRIPITSIAVSSGVQDTGTFDLDFRGSGQYGPFEGAGAISKWQIHLPEKHKQFDYRTISDVVMHLRYTSVVSNGKLKEVAETAIDSAKPSPLAINLKDDYASEWHHMRSKAQNSPSTMILTRLLDRFPFWTRGKTVKLSSVKLLVYPGVQSASLGAPKSATPATLTRNDGAAVGEYTALTVSAGTLPPLNQQWEINMGTSGLDRGWLLMEYTL